MGAGHWLNPNSGKCLQVTTHDAWIRVRANAESIGLDGDLFTKIMALPATAIDDIRILALQGGLVRIRQHRWYTSVQFWATADEVAAILRAVVRALKILEVHLDTRAVIDNLLLGESMVVSVRELPACCGTCSASAPVC